MTQALLGVEDTTVNNIDKALCSFGAYILERRQIRNKRNKHIVCLMVISIMEGKNIGVV